MAKIAYNACYGRFSLSREAILLARKLSKNPKWGGPCINGDEYESGRKVESDHGHIDDVPRHDPHLIAAIEKLGARANGSCARIAIEEIQSGTPYRIDEYDGMESVATCDSYEWTTAP